MSKIKREGKSSVRIPATTLDRVKNLGGLASRFFSLRTQPYQTQWLDAEARINAARIRGKIFGIGDKTLDLIFHNLKLEAQCVKWGDPYQIAKEFERRVGVLINGEH